LSPHRGALFAAISNLHYSAINVYQILEKSGITYAAIAAGLCLLMRLAAAYVIFAGWKILIFTGTGALQFIVEG